LEVAGRMEGHANAFSKQTNCFSSPSARGTWSFLDRRKPPRKCRLKECSPGETWYTLTCSGEMAPTFVPSRKTLTTPPSPIAGLRPRPSRDAARTTARVGNAGQIRFGARHNWMVGVLCGNVFPNDPTYRFRIVWRYTRMNPTACVELDARFLVGPFAIQVVPVHEVAGSPEPPLSSYRPQRIRLHRADGTKWYALVTPGVVPADDDAVVVTGDSTVVVQMIFIVHSKIVCRPFALCKGPKTLSALRHKAGSRSPCGAEGHSAEPIENTVPGHPIHRPRPPEHAGIGQKGSASRAPKPVRYHQSRWLKTPAWIVGIRVCAWTRRPSTRPGGSSRD
jgi:hypothetical protein